VSHCHCYYRPQQRAVRPLRPATRQGGVEAQRGYFRSKKVAIRVFLARRIASILPYETSVAASVGMLPDLHLCLFLTIKKINFSFNLELENSWRVPLFLAQGWGVISYSLHQMHIWNYYVIITFYARFICCVVDTFGNYSLFNNAYQHSFRMVQTHVSIFDLSWDRWDTLLR